MLTPRQKEGWDGGGLYGLEGKKRGREGVGVGGGGGRGGRGISE